MHVKTLSTWPIGGLLLLTATVAQAQLRVVAYNTLDKPLDATAASQARMIFAAIAATDRNGVAKRPDIIALQEQRSFGGTNTTAHRLADELNDLFGVTSYQATLSGVGTDQVGAVYDSAAVTLEATSRVFTRGPRDTLRYAFQPVGYDSPDATLYQYSSHFKAGSSSADRTTREDEGRRVRTNADALGADPNAIFAGDFNFGNSNEAGYRNLIDPGGTGRGFDPIDLAFWPSSGVAEHLTQSTRTTGNGGAGGGMDDRFDLQIVTSGLLDGEGLSYLGPTSVGLSSLEHSHQAFGNDGNTYNTRINATFLNRSQSPTVINALHDFSDHLPVVADYQLPAVLGVEVEPIPLTVALGESLSLEVSVSNAADVVATAGADELDYVLSTSGDLSGAFSGTLAALAADALHDLVLDTSVLGVRSGVLTVSSSSQAAANALFELPISYEVVAPLLAGDYNDDGLVDAADYTVWADGLTLANETATPGVVTAEDYTVWADNYGAAATTATTVPEPEMAWLLATALAGVGRRR